MPIPRNIIAGKTVKSLAAWARENGIPGRTAVHRWVIYFKDQSTITEQQANVLTIALRKRKEKS